MSGYPVQSFLRTSTLLSPHTCQTHVRDILFVEFIRMRKAAYWDLGTGVVQARAGDAGLTVGFFVE